MKEEKKDVKPESKTDLVLDSKEQVEKEETAETMISDAKENAQSMIDNANTAAKRLEAANTEMRSILDQQAATKAEAILGGTTNAGEVIKPLTEDEKIEESARKLLKGTGLEDHAFPKKE